MSQKMPSEVVPPDARNRPSLYYTAAYLQAGLLGAMLAFLFANIMQDYMVPLEDYIDNARPLINYGGLLTNISIVTFGCFILLEAYLMKWRKPNAGSFLRRLLAACGIVVLLCSLFLFVLFTS